MTKGNNPVFIANIKELTINALQRLKKNKEKTNSSSDNKIHSIIIEKPKKKKIKEVVIENIPQPPTSNYKNTKNIFLIIFVIIIAIISIILFMLYVDVSCYYYL